MGPIDPGGPSGQMGPCDPSGPFVTAPRGTRGTAAGGGGLRVSTRGASISSPSRAWGIDTATQARMPSCAIEPMTLHPRPPATSPIGISMAERYETQGSR